MKLSSIDCHARLCYNVLPDYSDPAKSCKLFCKISPTTAFYHCILNYGISRYVTLRKQVVTLWGYVINVHIYRIIISFASADTQILFSSLDKSLRLILHSLQQRLLGDGRATTLFSKGETQRNRTVIREAWMELENYIRIPPFR